MYSVNKERDMEINETNLQQLGGYLQQTLSPDPNVRRPGAHIFNIVK